MWRSKAEGNDPRACSLRRRLSRNVMGLSMVMVVGQMSACAEGGESGPLGLAGDLGNLEVRALAGSDQEAPVGSLLGEPLVLQVVRADGTPVPGVEVEWTFQNGRGATNTALALSGRTSKVLEVTDANGRSEVWWELGTTPGEQEARGGLVGSEVVGVQGPQKAPGGRSWRRWKARAKVGVPAVVEVSPESALLEVGDTLAVKATVKDAYGNVVTGETVSWKSYNAAVATVAPSGTVEANGVGETVISATAGSALGKAWMTVVASEPPDSVGTDLPIERVRAEPDTVRFSFVGETTELSVTAEDGTGAEVSGATFGFESSNSSIVQVDSMGRLTSRAVGMAAITVSALCCDAADSVVVIVDNVPREISISVDGSTATTDTLELEVGQTAELSAAARNEVGNVVGDVEITWWSSNSAVATVNGSGQVNAVAPGDADITASAAGLTAVMPTVVAEPETPPTVTTLDISPGTNTLTGIGSTRQLTLTARDADGNVMNAPDVTWQTSNPSVATVNSSGLVTAQGLGAALISVAAACCSAEPSQVTVEEEVVGGSGEVAWSTDWRAARGTTTDALRDGGKWSSHVGNTSPMLIVEGEPLGAVTSAAGLGFPGTMDNVFRSMVYEDGQELGFTVRRTAPSLAPYQVPAVGEYMFTRIYTRLEAREGDNVGVLHWLHWGGEGGHLWAEYVGRVTSGEISLALLANPNQHDDAVHWVTVPVNQTYRLEVRLFRDTSSTARLSVRLFDAAGNLLGDDDDFHENGTPLRAANPAISYDGNADAFFRQFQAGANNSVLLGGMVAPGFLYLGGLAVAVSSDPDMWIGGYPAANEGS